MKKDQRAPYLALAGAVAVKTGNPSILCWMCRHEESDWDELVCKHPLEAVVDDAESMGFTGADCWGFAPVAQRETPTAKPRKRSIEEMGAWLYALTTRCPNCDPFWTGTPDETCPLCHGDTLTVGDVMTWNGEPPTDTRH